ncbi:MAG TPA: hypothetical protein VK815_08695, partial [Candidatus Acidoferrales bacterium]|nr:hypothetical protein [Candidatus Acidoferrales bacterium]
EWKYLAALSQVEEAKRLPVPRGGRAPMIEDQKIDDALKEIWSRRKHTGAGPDTMGNVAIWNLQDADIVVAFENSPGGFKVTKQQVREARRAVVAAHKASETYAKRVLDKDGWLHIPAVKPEHR